MLTPYWLKTPVLMVVLGRLFLHKTAETGLRNNVVDPTIATNGT